MEELLYLVHRIPYPPNKGDKIRSYHLLKHLCRNFKVHLGAFVDDPEDWKYAQPLMDMVSGEVKLLPLNPAWATLRSTYGLLSGEPLSAPYYRNTKLKNWVDQMIAKRPIRHALVFSSAMSQYVTAYPNLHRIIDFVDIDSDKWRQYSERKSWPMSWIYQREARALFAFERRIAGTFDASVFVSRTEAELFQHLSPESSSRVTFYNNGVDLDYFSPAHIYDSPYQAGERVLVFTGAMDYWANVDAVTWFAREVFPALRAKFPELRFYIVGSRPPEVVRALAGAGIVVTGSVPDVRPYVAHAAISVAPLRIARGIQNKVLEAMAMGKPAVVSPQALEGIDAETNSEVLLAVDAAGFISCLAAQLSQPNRAIGEAARRRVESAYSWSNSLRRLDSLFGSLPAISASVD
ncbi:MAG: TIGR03087 family PEP-CTERM/XrtA system glycosyltransferase [Gallionellaceae bacterium]